MPAHSGVSITVGVWPFIPAMFNDSKPSAWPHFAGKPNGPLHLFIQWSDEAEDDYWIGIMKSTLDSIKQVAIAEGCTDGNLPVYLNTALAASTDVQDIYKENLPAVRSARGKYDPGNVMSLTGGFRVPFQ
jgi:hypothetical protein